MIKKEIIKLVGITVLTNNANEFNPEKAKIGLTMQRYFGEGLANKINDRKNPNVTFAAYTDYESDFTGKYKYFLGEEVNSLDNIPQGFESLIIPEQSYIKFTSQPGITTEIVIGMWKNIWDMSADKLDRAYIADFELYDLRNTDLTRAVLDIYIGIKN